MTDRETALLRLECLKLAIPLSGSSPTVADIAKTTTELYAVIATTVSGKNEATGRRTKDKTPFG